MNSNEKAMIDLFVNDLNDIGTCVTILLNEICSVKEDAFTNSDPDEDKNLAILIGLKLLMNIKRKEYKSNQTSPYREVIESISNVSYVQNHIVYQTDDGNVHINGLYNSNINRFEDILISGMKNNIDYSDKKLSTRELFECGLKFLKRTDPHITDVIIYNQYEIVQYDDNRTKIFSQKVPYVPYSSLELESDHKLNHYELISLIRKTDSIFLRNHLDDIVFNENNDQKEN